MSNHVDIDPHNLEMLEDLGKHGGFKLWHDRISETLAQKRNDLENGVGKAKQLRGEITAYKVALGVLDVLIREQKEGLKDRENN